MKFHKNGTKPLDGEVFVFGSNLAGIHGAGAALLAKQEYGAVQGKGFGFYGQSYAIPTKNENIISLDMFSITAWVEEFIKFVNEHPEKNFFLTAVGCGLAHKSHKEMSELFTPLRNHDNISFPDVWEKYLLEEEKLINWG